MSALASAISFGDGVCDLIGMGSTSSPADIGMSVELVTVVSGEVLDVWVSSWPDSGLLVWSRY
jgi:hypothetical protein